MGTHQLFPAPVLTTAVTAAVTAEVSGLSHYTGAAHARLERRAVT